MEVKSDSVVFNELLITLDAYNEVYKDGLISYIHLHTLTAAEIKQRNIQSKQSKYKRRGRYDYDSDDYEEMLNRYDSDEEKNNSDNTKELDANTNSNSTTLSNAEIEEEKKKYDLSKQNFINLISNVILDLDYVQGLYYLNEIKGKMANYLIAQVLDNSPEADVVVTKFPNIKTQLYPYQINNLNWMLCIENKKYPEQFKDQTSKLLFRGGGLFDEVGMGKTLQIITLINTNKSSNTSLICKDNDKIYTKATLIIVPNHLCGQWTREFGIHLTNPIKIINLLTKVHYKKYTYFDFVNADVVIVSANFFTNCKLNQHEEIDPLFNILNIFDKDVNIFSIYWHRVVIDEYHEIEDSQLFIKLKFLESDFRWIISGTPFKEKYIEQHMELDSTSLSSVVDYLTLGTNNINKVDIYKLNNYNYVKNHFSRNTHKKNMQILKLPEIVEETMWLNFTQTERMIYNAYLADPNNTVNDVFLRQVCCHPMISDKIRENITNKVESLEDIKTQIKKMYMGEYEKAEENYKICTDRIDRIQAEMKEMEKELKTGLRGYQDLKEDLEMAKYKSIDLKKIRDGKEKTVVYYKTFIDLISDMENVKKENCTICLDPIKEEDLGITFCGHIYCYSCISTIVKEAKSSGLQSSCPACKKELNIDKIFLMTPAVSKEANMLGTKLAYIINYIKSTPNKYRIIFSQWDYLLKEVGKVLEANGIKQLYCQGNVYQKDKVLRLFNSPNPDTNEFKIIMLSSESTVSGSNLNNAEEVIFLDPIYGDKQYRLNTENQAIGRVRRLGNKHSKIKVLRLLIKDSVEEEIYKTNQKN
jgi:DNA repair protein RAD5